MLRWQGHNVNNSDKKTPDLLFLCRPILYVYQHFHYAVFYFVAYSKQLSTVLRTASSEICSA